MEYFEYPEVYFSDFFGFKEFTDSDDAGFEATFEITASASLNIILECQIEEYEVAQGWYYDW